MTERCRNKVRLLLDSRAFLPIQFAWSWRTGKAPLHNAKERVMATYQQMVAAYLASYQPALKAELEQQGRLLAYLDEQAASMQEAKAALAAQLRACSPQISPLQCDMEAERIVLEMFLPTS